MIGNWMYGTLVGFEMEVNSIPHGSCGKSVPTSYLEKAASGASGAFGHFVQNHAILRTFWVKSPVFLTEDGGRRIGDGELRLDQGDFRQEDWE